MNPVEKIRMRHIDNILHELAAKPHRKRIMHLNEIGSIGLIMQIQSDQDNITISQFNSMLKSRSITLRTIQLPRNPEEQTDKYGLPKEDYIQPFTKYYYDLLIDATPNGTLFGPFVTLNTSSALRIGYSIIPPTPGKKENEKLIIESHLSNSEEPPTINSQLVRANTNVSPYNLNEIYDLLILGHEPLELSRFLPTVLEYLVQIRKTE